MRPLDSGNPVPSTPTWSRFKDIRNSTSSDTYRAHLHSSFLSAQRTTMSTYTRASSTYRSLSVLQRVLFVLAGLAAIATLVLFLRFGESVFGWIAPLAQRWRGVTGGWVLLWLLTLGVGVPPLIGYSSCVAIAGFVYGMWAGWLIVASATIIGSTLSFLLCRRFLSGFVHRLVAHDRRFAALSLTLKHDGLKLLVMIRLCPLPYSLSNGALSTFETVNWQSFMFATAVASPKLLIHTFIGSRFAKIADNVGVMDPATKAINYISIFVSMCVGATTAWFIYRQTKKRAAELEAQEGAALCGNGRVDDDLSDYEEEDFARQTVSVGPERTNGISGVRYADETDNSSELSREELVYKDENSDSGVRGSNLG